LQKKRTGEGWASTRYIDHAQGNRGSAAAAEVTKIHQTRKTDEASRNKKSPSTSKEEEASRLETSGLPPAANQPGGRLDACAREALQVRSTSTTITSC